MDPNECFRCYINCMCDEDTVEAMLRLEDLIQWYNNGGYPARFPDSSIPVPLMYLKTSWNTLFKYNLYKELI